MRLTVRGWIVTAVLTIGFIILAALNAGANACAQYGEGTDAYAACVDLNYS